MNSHLYALHLRGKIKKGEKVLIHFGTGSVGQPAIYLALYEGCEVFTTVGNVEKRHFIKKIFPSISEDHIGNSRDTSFEQMITQKTKGRGVDIVLNSLAGEKLQASIRCLAKGGRFIEIRMFDMISNNPLEIFAFSRGISFYGIKLDKLFSAKQENKVILSNKIIEDIKKKAIKPLCRKVFERDEIETAFRYMIAGKHIGKYIMEKIEDQKEFLIVDYSFGSLIAIELARLLETKNFVGRLILIDGAPDWMKFLVEKLFNYTSQQELQNNILLRLMKMYLEYDSKMVNQLSKPLL